MSKEMAVAFVEKVYSNIELKQKLVNLGTDPKIGAILDLAESYGFYFSQKDLVEAIKTTTPVLSYPAGPEMAETEQAAVGGGLRNRSHLSPRAKTVL